jgi:hypothetical protein
VHLGLVSTAYQGNGMFCISMPVSETEQTPNVPVPYTIISLMMLEITRFADWDAPARQARQIELPRQVGNAWCTSFHVRHYSVIPSMSNRVE